MFLMSLRSGMKRDITMKTMQEIQVSVIIPVYNTEKYISKCLDSVLFQTLEKIEVICIDDGSEDNSLKILRQYQNKDSRVRVYSVSNGGSGRARNVGIAKAKGKYIAFMDSDDWYFDRNVLEILYMTAEEKKVEICGGSLCRSLNGHIVPEYGKLRFNHNGYVNFEDYQFCKGYYRFIYSNEMLRRKRICFPYYLRNQDPPFMLRAMLEANTFYAISKIVYCHRLQPGHVNWTEQRLCDTMRGTAYLLNQSQQHHLEELHSNLIKLFFEELDISIFDLRKLSIRKAIKVVGRQIDYNLAYRNGLFKRTEKFEQRVVKTVLLRNAKRLLRV